MIKALVVEEGNRVNGVSLWRLFMPFQEMRRRFPFEFHVTQMPTPALIAAHDVVILFRPTDSQALKLLDVCQSLRVPVVIDCDDNIFSLPTGHPQKLYYDGLVPHFRELYGKADWVWTSTEELMYALDAFDRGCIVKNAIDPAILPDAPNKFTGTYLWRGNEAQICDLWKAEPWYENIKRDAKRFIWWGYIPPYKHLQNIVPVRWEQSLDFWAALRRTGANYLWKPLTDNPFNNAKSNIAWIEATVAGGVCVTNFAGNVGWEYATESFIPPEEIPKLWQESCEEIRANYNLAVEAEKRYRSLADLVGLKSFAINA